MARRKRQFLNFKEEIKIKHSNDDESLSLSFEPVFANEWLENNDPENHLGSIRIMIWGRDAESGPQYIHDIYEFEAKNEKAMLEFVDDRWGLLLGINKEEPLHKLDPIKIQQEKITKAITVGEGDYEFVQKVKPGDILINKDTGAEIGTEYVTMDAAIAYVCGEQVTIVTWNFLEGKHHEVSMLKKNFEILKTLEVPHE